MRKQLSMQLEMRCGATDLGSRAGGLRNRNQQPTSFCRWLYLMADSLSLLLDREAVAEVLYAYCEAVDRNDAEGALGLFTPDAVFDFGYGRVNTGHQELALLFDRLALNEATSHHVSNVVVDIYAPDKARAHSVVYAFHRRKGTGREIHLWGRYTDELVKDGRTWRFRRRVLRAAAEKGTEPYEGNVTFYERIARSDG